jgi:hypothetical protein
LHSIAIGLEGVGRYFAHAIVQAVLPAVEKIAEFLDELQKPEGNLALR